MGFGLADWCPKWTWIGVSRMTSAKILPGKRDVKLSGIFIQEGKKLLNTQYSACFIFYLRADYLNSKSYICGSQYYFIVL